jgi:hypothetical protein
VLGPLLVAALLVAPGSPAPAADPVTVNPAGGYGSDFSGEVVVKPKKPIVVVKNKAVPATIKLKKLKGVPAKATAIWFLRRIPGWDRPQGLFLPVKGGAVQLPPAARGTATLTVAAWTEHRSSTAAMKPSDYLVESPGYDNNAEEMNDDGWAYVLRNRLLHNAAYFVHLVTPQVVWSGTVPHDGSKTFTVAGKSGVPKLGTTSPLNFAMVEHTAGDVVETLLAPVDDLGRVTVNAWRGRNSYRVVSYATYEQVNRPRALNLYTAVIDNFGGGMDWARLGQHVTDEELFEGRTQAVEQWKASLGDWITSTSVKQPQHYTSKILASLGKCRASGYDYSTPPKGYVDERRLVSEAEQLFPGVDFSSRGPNILVIDPPEDCQGPDGNYIQSGSNWQNAHFEQQNVIVMGFNANDAVSDDKVATISSGTVHEVGHILGLEHAQAGWCKEAGASCPNVIESAFGMSGMNGSIANYAERALFTGAIGDDEYQDVTLPSGQTSTTQQFTLAPITASTGLRTLHLITAPKAGQRDGGRVEYWLNYGPSDLTAYFWGGAGPVKDWQGNPSGLAVVRSNTARGNGLPRRDIVAENLDHQGDNWHYFQPGETFANYDGRVTIHVDSMDDAGLTLTVTLER